MDMKRILTGAVVGGVVMAAVGYLIWGMLMADWFAANAGSADGVWRESRIWWATILGSIVLAALLTSIIDKCDDLSVMNGFKWGGMVGFMIWLGVDMLFYGASNLGNLTSMLVDPVLEFVRWGIAGAAIAWVLGMGGSAAGAPSSEY